MGESILTTGTKEHSIIQNTFRHSLNPSREKPLFRLPPSKSTNLRTKRQILRLKYFPENEALRLEVEEYPNAESIEIQTSTGDVQIYYRFGCFNFKVGGEEVQLTIYDTDFGFFLPFLDVLANTETYGAGRYLEPERLPNGKFLADFRF